jgi:hypothetical protein
LLTLHDIERKCRPEEHECEDADGETNEDHGTYGFQSMTMRLQIEAPGARPTSFEIIQPNRHPSNSQGAEMLPARAFYFISPGSG